MVTVLAAHRLKVEDCAKKAGVEIYPDGYVLSYRPDCLTPVRPDSLTQAFVRLRDRLGLDVRFHDLRHFSATQLLGTNVDPRTVAGRLGHADAFTTMRVYASFLEQRDREAAAIIGSIVAGVLEPPPTTDVVDVQEVPAEA